MVNGRCGGIFGVRLVGFSGNDFLMLSGCVALLSISVFFIFFYIGDNIRSRCGRKAK